jgi:hypothetical protein
MNEVVKDRFLKRTKKISHRLEENNHKKYT